MGGKLTLIKSVLQALPSYFLSLFSIPKTILKVIDSKMCNFLWNGKSDRKRLHWAAWKAVRAPKLKGGMGLKDLKAMNEALLIKWIWRFYQEDGALWKEVISAKYGHNPRQWEDRVRNSSYGCGVWKGIQCLSTKFQALTKWELGNGESILFWHDVWLGQTKLKERFPLIFDIASDQNALVSSMFDSDRLVWNICTRRNLNDWELDQYIMLCDSLNEARINSVRDKRVWKEGFDKPLCVKECYERVSPGASVMSQALVRVLHRKHTPPRVLFLIWATFIGRIPTLDSLMHRGFQLANRCILCKGAEESADHLFLRCRIASNLWDYFMRSLKSQWCRPDTITDMFEQWDGIVKPRSKKEIWDLVPVAIVWNLWKDRNDKIFKESNSFSSVDVEDVKGTIHYWISGSSNFNGSTYLDVVRNWEAWVM